MIHVCSPRAQILRRVLPCPTCGKRRYVIKQIDALRAELAIKDTTIDQLLKRIDDLTGGLTVSASIIKI